MRWLVFLCPLVVMAQMAITPPTPSVPSGQTITLTSNTPVNWSASGVGSLSNVTPTSATYSAPAGVVAKNQMLGCPVGPNDSVFNTRIDNLPVDNQSDAWIAGSTANPTLFETDNWGVSAADNTTPMRTLRTYYSAVTVPNFVMPPAGPNLKRQGGAYVGTFGIPTPQDHHVMTVRHTDCTFYESYDDYLNGYTRVCSDGSEGCNVQSAVTYSSMSYTVPGPDGGTNAGGLPLAPTTWQLSEIESGNINHATVFTTNTSAIQFGTWLWPASTTAGGCVAADCPNAMPMGARLRLKSSFNAAAVCNSGIARQDAICNGMLTALEQYGMILCDTGLANAVQMVSDVSEEPVVEAAVQELTNAQIGFTNFEVVDESSLEVSATSYQVCPFGQACLGGVNQYVAPSDQAVITATAADGTSVSTPIAIQAVSVGLGVPPIVGMTAGNYSYQIPFWVNGSVNQSVTWSLISGAGSVSSGGVYTPPAETGGAGLTESAMLRVVSNADPAAAATLQLTILPAASNGVVRIDTGSPESTVDGNGNVWTADIGIEGGAFAIPGDYPHWAKVDPATAIVYESLQDGADLGHTLIVPNGTYTVHLLFGVPINGMCSVCTTWLAPVGPWNDYTFAPYILEAQGQIQNAAFDFGALSSYLFQTPVDEYITATVTNNLLQVYVRSVMSDQPPYDVPTGSQKHTFLNGLEVIPTSAATSTQAAGWMIDTGGQTAIAPGQTLNPFSIAAGGGATSDAEWSIQSGPSGATLAGSSLTLAANSSSNTSPIVVLATNGVYSATASIAIAPASSSATYSGLDSTTQGKWSGVYGTDGYMIANDKPSLPIYTSIALSRDSIRTWASPTTDVRAPQTASGTSTRMASAFYSYGSVVLDVNLTDGNAHRLALYLLDWNNLQRSETISVVDAASGAVLDTRTFSGFENGQYASWMISGHVIVRVAMRSGVTSVLSGIFFDTPSGSPALQMQGN